MRNLKLIAALVIIGLVAVHAIPRKTTTDGGDKSTLHTEAGTQTDGSDSHSTHITTEDGSGGDTSGDSSGDISGDGSGSGEDEYDVLIEGELEGENSDDTSEQDDSSAGN
ncbi:Ba38.1 [Baboon cytomegalovirus]|nr:Ba38.1 [Baboon cytomegalovirus]